MAQKKKSSVGYFQLAASVKSGQIGNFYIFHGDERYLLERSLEEIRRNICPGGLNSFNYKRFEGKDISLGTIDDAINTLPAFAYRTLVEIHDFDIFEHKEKLSVMLADLPDYICVIFVFGTIPFKPDGRKKADSALLMSAQVVEFTVQEQDELTKWIMRHFKDAGKRITSTDAEYMALITGGLMTALHSEISKVSAYAAGETVTREDIDAVTTPTLDTAVYKLTDSLLRRDHAGAMRILDELLRMREAPHKLMFSISLKMRQLLAACICDKNKLGKDKLMEICDIRYDFQARALMNTARKTSLSECRNAVLACSETAFALNTGSDPEASIIELVAKLAVSHSSEL